VGKAFTQVFATTDVWRYDAAANTFTAMPDLPEARGAGGLVAVGRKLHFFGGGDLDRADRAEHWVLDLDAQAAGWVDATPLPMARTHMGYANLNGKIYAIGGHTGLHEDLIPTGRVDVFDPASPGQWTTVASTPNPVSHIGSSTVVSGGRIIAFGGERGDANDIREVVAYNPVSNSWAALTPLPGARFSGVAGEIDDVFYFAVGSNQSSTFRGVPVA
jgi:N-acetylneuraminic acid mutarotase